jgi:hypothetical protein
VRDYEESVFDGPLAGAQEKSGGVVHVEGG